MTADVLSRPGPRPGHARAPAPARARALDAVAAVEHLVGLQAQEPLDPYLALWSRLDRFDPDELGRCLDDRALVRIVVMRGTIHLVTADDALVLRPLMQPVLDEELARHAEFAPHLAGVDLARSLAFGRTLLAERPRPVRSCERAWPSASPTSRRRAGLRLPQPPRPGAGPAARAVGPHRPGHAHHRSRHGWAGRWPPRRRSTTWCCATSPPSGPPPWPTWRRGRA